jgi:hypothetical protein
MSTLQCCGTCTRTSARRNEDGDGDGDNVIRDLSTSNGNVIKSRIQPTRLSLRCPVVVLVLVTAGVWSDRADDAHARRRRGSMRELLGMGHGLSRAQCGRRCRMMGD